MARDTINPFDNNRLLSKKLNDALAGIQQETVSLTAAQLRTLNSSPVQLVAAQGRGKLILPTFTFVEYHFGTLPFLSVDASTGLELTVGDSLCVTLTGAVLGKTESRFDWEGGSQLSSSDSPFNQPLMLRSNDTDWAAGLLTSAVINNRGSGYTAGDNVALPDFSYGWHIDTVNGSGAVQTYHDDYGPITGRGTVQNGTVALTDGTGTGLTFDVALGSMGDGTLDMVVQYAVLNLG